MAKGAAPREAGPSGVKAENGRSEPGRTGETDDGPDAAASKDRDPSRTQGDAAETRRPGATVKVIAGTRRYHAVACPLIKGAGDAGVETMTLGQAEAAGLTACSVCQHDRETVS